MSEEKNNALPLPQDPKKAFYAALAKAQGEFPPIPKDSKVDVKNKEGKFLYSYNYADLTTIIDCTRPALSKHGLSFYFDYIKDESREGIATLINHADGFTLQSGYVPCKIMNQDMKFVAGQFTYAKRISLTAALGVSADEDVDAASLDAMKDDSTTKKTKQPLPDNLRPRGPVSKPNPQNPQSYPQSSGEGENQEASSLASYVIPFGKFFKGRRLDQINPDALIGVVEDIYAKAKSTGKDIPAEVKEFLENAEQYLSIISKAESADDAERLFNES